MHLTVLNLIQRLLRYREENAAVWLCVVYYCKNPTSCCWMNQPTTLMPNRCIGSKCICNNIKVLLLPLLTIVIFSITLPVGYSNLIGERAYHGKEITLHGWNKSLNVWSWNKNKNPNAKRHSNANWNGYACRPKHVKQNRKPVWMPMTDY